MSSAPLRKVFTTMCSTPITTSSSCMSSALWSPRRTSASNAAAQLSAPTFTDTFDDDTLLNSFDDHESGAYSAAWSPPPHVGRGSSLSPSHPSSGVLDDRSSTSVVDDSGDLTPQLRHLQNVLSSSSLASSLHNHSSSNSSSSAGSSAESLLSTFDVLCDDLFVCKTDVLRQFTRSRGIPGSSKAEVVLNVLQRAHEEAHGDSSDLTHTKRVLGDVFQDDVRTSGVRAQWTNKALEASHVEMACERHAKFTAMCNSSKKLMVRRHSRESAGILRRLTRMFQDEYETVATTAVGGVFRVYKEELDTLVNSLSVTEIVSPFASYLVSTICHTTSVNLMTRTDPTGQLIGTHLIRPVVEDGDQSTLESFVRLLDSVVREVDQRAVAYGDNKVNWGSETPLSVLDSLKTFTEMSQQQQQWQFDEVPEWVLTLARQFGSWEAVVRNDVPLLATAPPLVFHIMLSGAASWQLLQKIHASTARSSDIPKAYVGALKLALQQHLNDENKALEALSKLMSYVQVTGEGSETFRPEFFAQVSQQMQSALYSPETNDGSSITRIAVVLRESTLTASRCERCMGLFPLMVKLTEDLRFHLRFHKVFQQLGSKDRETVRTRNIHMLKTLHYFENELDVKPISTKAVALLVVVLLYFSSRSAGASQAILERFSSCSGKDEFGIVSLAEVSATTLNDIRVALPPQLSYSSWLQQDEKQEKSVYNVVPSAAVKGSSNQAMLVSQAPMMKALDAISRVPWRINKYMLHVQEAMVREGFGFGKVRPAFYPLHYCAKRNGEIHHASLEESIFNTRQRREYHQQLDKDWQNLSDLRSSRVHYLQALRQARSLVQFSHLYFPNSMDFRGRMYPIPGRLNHTGSDPFRALLEYAEPKPLGSVGLYWLKVHLANKMGMNKLSFDERAQYVDEHIEDVVRSAESPLSGEKWWQEASEPMQCLMACQELSEALKCSQGPESFLSRLPVAVDGSYNGLQHYSAIGRDAFGAELVNLVPSERPADAYTGILKEMLRCIQDDAKRDNQVAQRCLGTGKGSDKNHIKRKTIKRPIMTQVYGVTGYGMSEQILDELVKQNASHGLWTTTDMKEMAAYLREKVLDSLGVTFRETQQCRKWLSTVTELIWNAQPTELRNAFCWTTPLGLIVRQPYRVRKEHALFTVHGYSKIPGDSVTPASRKQLSALAPNLIHSLDATHLAMTALEMQARGLSMMAVHDSYWTYACDLPEMSSILREQFVALYSKYDPLWELKEQWEESFFLDLRRHGVRLPDPPQRGTLDLNVVLQSQYFFS